MVCMMGRVSYWLISGYRHGSISKQVPKQVWLQIGIFNEVNSESIKRSISDVRTFTMLFTPHPEGLHDGAPVLLAHVRISP